MSSISRFFAPKRPLQTLSNDDGRNTNEKGHDVGPAAKRPAVDPAEALKLKSNHDVISIQDESSKEENDSDVEILDVEILEPSSMGRTHEVAHTTTAKQQALHSKTSDETTTKILKKNPSTIDPQDLQQDNVQPEASDSHAANPFARFAFGGTITPPQTAKSEKPHNPSKSKTIMTHFGKRKNAASLVRSSKNTRDKRNTRREEKRKSMQDLPLEEQNRIVQKWHSLIDASTTPLEDARFQLLVAARLHARCQQAPVAKAMQALLQTHTLTVATVAKMDPMQLVQSIHNLPHYQTKAKHIVQAAQQIQSRFNGTVPEDVNSLESLMGIGPVLADLLACINQRSIHQAQREKLTDP